MPGINQAPSEAKIIADLRRQVASIARSQKPRLYTYTKTGAISATSTGGMRLYNDTGHDLTIIAVRASLRVAPSTTSVIVDVKQNGTTLYTTSGHRPTLTTGSNTVAAALPDVTTWTAGNYLTVDVDQADAAATDLTVQVTAV